MIRDSADGQSAAMHRRSRRDLKLLQYRLSRSVPGLFPCFRMGLLHWADHARPLSCMDRSLHGHLLVLDPSGFDESGCAFTLALHEARELGPRHVHWLAPVLGDPVAQIRPGEQSSDVIRKLVNHPGRSASRNPYSIPQIEKSNPATPASAIVGASGSKVERRAVLTPNATSVPLRMWGRAREMGTR